MVVIYRYIALCLCILTWSGWSAAQNTPRIEASVESTEVHVFKPFLLNLYYQGPGPVEYQFPPNVGFKINPNPRGRSERTSIINGMRSLKAEYALVVEVAKAGEVTIPPIKAIVAGQTFSTEPITLTVKNDDPAFIYPIHVRVRNMIVKKGEWFWVYIDSPWLDKPLPNQLPAITGLENAPGLPLDDGQSSYVPSRSRTQTRGYRVRATQSGTITIPSMTFQLHQQSVNSNPLELKVLDRPSTTTEDIKGNSGLPFVRMDVDTRDIYLGEPVLMTLQLWVPKQSPFDLSARNRSTTSMPSTEGFYASDVQNDVFEAHLGTQAYHVNEQRKLLYPTKTGELTIDAYRYEGDIVNRGRRNEYLVEYGPYKVNVKHLPPAPNSYTGAIGQFNVEVDLSSTKLKEGIPTELIFVVSGQGNADAIASPKFPELSWAHVAEVKREQKDVKLFGQVIPAIEKKFRYTITPTRAGSHEIPAIQYASFDPHQGKYIEDTFGPFNLTVSAGEEDSVSMVVEDSSIDIFQRTPLIGTSIHPLMTMQGSLHRDQTRKLWLYLVLILPILLYLIAVHYLNRHARLVNDTSFARAQGAYEKGKNRLKAVHSSSEPSEELYRTMIDYLGDIFNINEQGLTFKDVEDLLEVKQIDSENATTITRILKSCERSRYAAQKLTDDEVGALVQAVKNVMHALEIRGKQNRGGK
jgi:hypothetical protein